MGTWHILVYRLTDIKMKVFNQAFNPLSFILDQENLGFANFGNI